MKLEKLKNKKILILGLGEEGTDALDFIKIKYPKQIVAVADRNNKIKKNKKVIYYTGENYLNKINEYDIIIKSPGIHLSKIKPFIKKNNIITSVTDIFLNNCRGLVIGVTGTKGKSSTCSLIYEILKSEKYKVNLIGNIGKPVLKYLINNDPQQIYIYELSSFQLALTNKSPDISIVLNIFKDHLDYHSSFNEYLECKKNIFKFQKQDDFLIYNKKDKTVRKMIEKAKSQKIPFTPDNNNIELFNVIGDLFRIDDSVVEKKIKKVKALPHRMEFLGKYNNIYFYNDSAATIPEATIKAINSLNNEINTIIIGGVDKGFNFNKLVKSILKSKIENVIYFPETGITIKNKIEKETNKIKTFIAKDMKQAVMIAFKKTKKNRICLLSPAASSFNMFKNSKERGNLFKKYVKNEEK